MREKHFSEAVRKNMSKAHIGMIGFWRGKYRSEKTKKKIKEALKGRKLSEEAKMKRQLLRGDKAPNWRGGTTPLVKSIKGLQEYKEWRHRIFVRDRFTCVECHKVGGRLNAHHIKAFTRILRDNNITTLIEAQMCEELWNVNNGVTLCKECHEKTDNYGGGTTK